MLTGTTLQIKVSLVRVGSDGCSRACLIFSPKRLTQLSRGLQACWAVSETSLIYTALLINCFTAHWLKMLEKRVSSHLFALFGEALPFPVCLSTNYYLIPPVLR